MHGTGSVFLFLAVVLLSASAPLEAQGRPHLRPHLAKEAESPVERKTRKEKVRKFNPKRHLGPQRVEIDLSEQMLWAYQGDRLVLKTRISSGRGRSTPTGQFSAGWKDADHYSSLYNNAPMPWSVQVRGNIFIHGFHTVPHHPASHGCIRLPLTGRNPAKRFFQWVEPGTPIVIRY